MRKRNFLGLLCLSFAVCIAAGCGEEATVYNVTLEENGGTVVSDIAWTAGTPLSVGQTTKEGYTFKGWYYDEALTNAVDLQSLAITGDTTLYAKWEAVPKTYTVTFETFAGTKLDPVVWTEGTPLSVGKTRNGKYTLTGWYYDEALTNAVDLANFTATQNATVYAKWEYIPQEYEIRFYTSETEYTSAYYTEGTMVDVSEWEIPASIYYEEEECPFAYWMDETYTSQVAEDFTMPSRSMAFYAQYDMPQMFKWSYADGAYTSTGYGVRPIKEAPTGYYGEYSVNIAIKNSSTTGVGIVWNLVLPETDDPYDDEDGCY